MMNDTMLIPIAAIALSAATIVFNVLQIVESRKRRKFSAERDAVLLKPLLDDLERFKEANKR